jgi:hypothetical protein
MLLLVLFNLLIVHRPHQDDGLIQHCLLSCRGGDTGRICEHPEFRTVVGTQVGFLGCRDLSGVGGRLFSNETAQQQETTTAAKTRAASNAQEESVRIHGNNTRIL